MEDICHWGLTRLEAGSGGAYAVLFAQPFTCIVRPKNIHSTKTFGY